MSFFFFLFLNNKCNNSVISLMCISYVSVDLHLNGNSLLHAYAVADTHKKKKKIPGQSYIYNNNKLN